MSFAVADGSVPLLVRRPTQLRAVHVPGTSFTLTANFADGTSASATGDGAGRADDRGVAPSAGRAGASLDGRR